MGGSVPPLSLIPYSFIVCLWTNLLLYTMSNHIRIYLEEKKYIFWRVCMGIVIVLGWDVVTEGD
jgi:hypothetical protein